MAAGGHARIGLQAARQGREGKVTLGLVGHSSRVEQTHHLQAERERKGGEREEGLLDQH